MSSSSIPMLAGRLSAILAQRPLQPAWPVRAVLAGIAVTALLFIAIPYLEHLAPPPIKDLSLRDITTTSPPAQPPPPRPAERKREPKSMAVPRPQLVRPLQQIVPVSALLDLDVALGGIGGDFNWVFPVASGALLRDGAEMIFEIAEIDQPPRPLLRMEPMYPPQARMRGIEGAVSLEFIVREDGRTTDIETIDSSPGDLFVRSAHLAVAKWRFEPGELRGKAVPVRVRQTIEFRLK